MKANKFILDTYVSEKKLRVSKHPTLDLFIYNYSKHTEYNSLWDSITRTCRGLVIDSNGEVHAHPFEKFFNLEQTDSELIKKLKNEKISFEVFEKMDGFLGIGFLYENKFIISSRGSFNSKQSKKANEIWKEKYAPYLKPIKGITYIFEIIYHEDKILVDYDFEDLVLLGARYNGGDEVAYENLKYIFSGNINKNYPKIVSKIDNISDFETVRECFPEKNNGNHEGFVIRFAEPYDGFRIKLKYSEYFRLAKIVSGISTISIWEFLKDKKDFEELLNLVPDEFYNWVKDQKKLLEVSFYNESKIYIKLFKSIYDNNITKKELILKMEMLNFSNLEKKLCFCQYDFKFDRFEKIIWNNIKPSFEKAFLND